MIRLMAVPSLLALSACASAGPESDAVTVDATRCFWPSQVSGFADAGPNRAVVRIGMVERWELTLGSGCSNVDWALSIGLRSRGGQAICPGRPAEVYVPDPSGNGGRTCLVRAIRRLPPESQDGR